MRKQGLAGLCQLKQQGDVDAESWLQITKGRDSVTFVERYNVMMEQIELEKQHSNKRKRASISRSDSAGAQPARAPGKHERSWFFQLSGVLYTTLRSFLGEIFVSE